MKTKTIFALILVVGISFSLLACERGNSNQKETDEITVETEIEKDEKSETDTNEESSSNIDNIETSKELENQEETTMQMSISANGNIIIYKLNDSKAARDLYEQLPLSVEVETYANNEIIFYPPSALDVTDTPLASGGGAGAIAYYAPWGDVVLFYDSFSPDGGLYELGQVVSGSENIKSMSGTITLTKTNE